jgi:hypothetical protein
MDELGIDGWMDKLMGGRMKGWMDGWMGGLMDDWGLMDGWTNYGWTNRWMN